MPEEDTTHNGDAESPIKGSIKGSESLIADSVPASA